VAINDARKIRLNRARNTNAAEGEENMVTNHKLIIGNSASMVEIPDKSVHLMVTSPPYFNAPFDYKGLFKTYGQYLELLREVASEVYRVIQDGRIAVLN